MENSFLDVIIIGGGPAGIAAAIQCKKKGLKVIVLEQEKTPKIKPKILIIVGGR